jgi:hypothetical protein
MIDPANLASVSTPFLDAAILMDNFGGSGTVVGTVVAQKVGAMVEWVGQVACDIATVARPSADKPVGQCAGVVGEDVGDASSASGIIGAEINFADACSMQSHIAVSVRFASSRATSTAPAPAPGRSIKGGSDGTPTSAVFRGVRQSKEEAIFSRVSKQTRKTSAHVATGRHCKVDAPCNHAKEEREREISPWTRSSPVERGGRAAETDWPWPKTAAIIIPTNVNATGRRRHPVAAGLVGGGWLVVVVPTP